jgi:hypothetical protein
MAKTTVKPGATQKQERRQRIPKPFPTMPFEECLRIAKAIQEYASGEKIRRITLFDHLQKSPDSGPTKVLIANCNKYDLIKGGATAEYFELSSKGRIASSDDISEIERKKAQIELGIIHIQVFNYLFEKYKNNKMPARQVLKDSLREISVNEVILEECIDIFIVNLKYLGLLRTISGSERIISLEHVIEESDSGKGGKYSEPINSEIKTLTQKTALVPVDDKDFENICFYITPINQEASEERKHADLFFGSIVEPVLETMNLRLIRADKISLAGLINTQIIEYLLKSKIVIADLSFHNPNVFYEIAIRHICRKPIVQIKREEDKIPFDLQQFRTISIDTSSIYTLVPKLEVYKSEIATQIRNALEDPESVDNPLSQHKDLIKQIITS